MVEISPVRRRGYEDMIARYHQMEKGNKRRSVYCVLQGLAGIVFFAVGAAVDDRGMGWGIAGLGALTSIYLVNLGCNCRALGKTMARARTDIESLLAGDPGPLQESIDRDLAAAEGKQACGDG